MSATRTQIYLTKQQRIRLDERGSQTGLRLAEMIRRAVDEYLGEDAGLSPALDETFGALPGLALAGREE